MIKTSDAPHAYRVWMCTNDDVHRGDQECVETNGGLTCEACGNEYQLTNGDYAPLREGDDEDDE